MSDAGHPDREAIISTSSRTSQRPAASIQELHATSSHIREEDIGEDDVQLFAEPTSSEQPSNQRNEIANDALMNTKYHKQSKQERKRKQEIPKEKEPAHVGDRDTDVNKIITEDDIQLCTEPTSS
jgi:hypothetical protein